jgi:hypothetical protein
MANWAQLQGVAAMKAKIRRAGQGMVAAVETALYQETEVEATEVKRRTPVWNPARPVPFGHAPGTLRSTVHVQGPFRDGRQVYTLVVCGGSLAPYAVYVHEDLEAYHATGQSKFLESVLLESRGYMAQRVQKRMRANGLR